MVNKTISVSIDPEVYNLIKSKESKISRALVNAWLEKNNYKVTKITEIKQVEKKSEEILCKETKDEIITAEELIK